MHGLSSSKKLDESYFFFGCSVGLWAGLPVPVAPGLDGWDGFAGFLSAMMASIAPPADPAGRAIIRFP